jgi:hypothetical protein
LRLEGDHDGHFTETSTQGFGSRLGNSFAGLIIGPLLVIGAIILLWWNEGRAVQGIVGLKDAASLVIEADTSGPSPADANKLITEATRRALVYAC